MTLPGLDPGPPPWKPATNCLKYGTAYEYASQCVEPDKGDIMDCMFYMENLEDLGKY
jgi:hypothetical protein